MTGAFFFDFVAISVFMLNGYFAIAGYEQMFGTQTTIKDIEVSIAVVLTSIAWPVFLASILYFALKRR